jgi:hypothetical protein
MDAEQLCRFGHAEQWLELAVGCTPKDSLRFIEVNARWTPMNLLRAFTPAGVI